MCFAFYSALMDKIQNLRFSLSKNVCLNMGALNSSLELSGLEDGNYTLRIILNPISRVILAYRKLLKSACCELPGDGAGGAKEACFPVKRIRTEHGHIVMELSAPVENTVNANSTKGVAA